MRGFRSVRSAAILAFAMLCGAAGPALAQGCDGTAIPDRIAAVEPGLEFVLASGRRVRVVDLREPPSVPDTGSAWLRSLPGAAVSVRAVGPSDRWSRVPARVTLADGAPVDVAEFLVGEGWAIADAAERDGLCDAGLLAIEAGARQRRLGVWAGEVVVLRATDGDALGREDGRFTIAEGRIVSVGERRDRTYLNLGRDWTRDLTVTITRRRWAAFKTRGLTAEALRGRLVRVRGIVEMRRGPVVEIAAPDMLELLPEEARRR